MPKFEGIVSLQDGLGVTTLVIKNILKSSWATCISPSRMINVIVYHNIPFKYNLPNDAYKQPDVILTNEDTMFIILLYN